MSTEIESPSSNIKILSDFKSLNETLIEIWASDDARPWDHVRDKKKFVANWDFRVQEERPRK